MLRQIKICDNHVISYDFIFNYLLNIKKIENIKKETFFLWNYHQISPYREIFAMNSLSKELKDELCFYIHLLIEINEKILSKQYSHIGDMDVEFISTNYKNVINNEIEIIINYIKNKFNNRRSKILGKVYNYSENRVEYELEDGNFIGLDEKENPIKMTLPLDLSCFPNEYLEYIGNTPMIREININNILE